MYQYYLRLNNSLYSSLLRRDVTVRIVLPYYLAVTSHEFSQLSLQ